VLDRVWQLNARPEIRNIIGQSESSFSMREVIEQRKVLLINLAGLGQATAGLAGTLLMNALWGAVQASGGRQQAHLLLDEFQDFLNLGQFEVLMKLAGSDGMSQPVSGDARPPCDGTGVAVTVRLQSRRKYGRPIEEVEEAIAARRKSTGPPPRQKRPNVGSTE